MSHSRAGNFNPLPKINRPICSAKMVGRSQQVECHTKVFACYWRLPFGGRRWGAFCTHPDNTQIANGQLVSGWVLTQPGTAPPAPMGNVSITPSGK